MNNSNRFEQFVSFAKRNDEERIVSGIASSEVLDDQGDIVAISAIENALPDYMKWANIREMHDRKAVGKAISAEVQDGSLRLDAHIVDDSSWKKVKNDVLKGFSIGGSVVKSEQRVKADGMPYRYITELKLSEISLVDRPANPEAVIELWKGANMSSPLDQEIDELTERITARNEALAKASEPEPEEEEETEEVEETEEETDESEADEEEDETSGDEDSEEAEDEDEDEESGEEEDSEEAEADEEEDDEAEETDDSDEDESEEDLEDEEEEDSDEEEEEEGDEPGGTDKASRGGSLLKAGSKGKAPAKAEDDSDEDPDGDGDNDEMSTPAFILSVLQAMRSSAEHSGDLDSARALGQACTALSVHRVNDPAEATPNAPGHEPNKQGGTSVPKGKEGAGMSSHFYLAQSISDLIKASYGGTNAGTGGKGVNLIKPSKTNPATVGGKGKKPKGSAVTSAGAVGRKSPAATGMHNAKVAPKAKPGGTFTQGSNKAAGAGDDLQKAYFEGLTKTLETISARLERVEGQPTDNGPMLRSVEKNLSGSTIAKGAGGKIDKVAMLQELAAQELDPQLKYQLGELAAKAELRGMYNFQN